ncbi:hypothetical protein QF015_002527 [Paenarthrobacter sp. TE4293]|uniref:hypothetical protein n=1 Tax=Paenarthrobacter sp. TE4293 TaxID=3381695 RepID=UPI003D2604C8
MIIQSGFDLALLARPHIVQAHGVLPRVVALGLDSDMCLDIITIVSDEFRGTLKPHFEEILDALRHQDTKYFAIAHSGCWPETYDGPEPILAEAAALKALASGELGLEMIGHFGMDETGYIPAGPDSYFDEYYNLLPETQHHWSRATLGRCG